MIYTIYAALGEEENEGWVWLESPNLPTRTLVKIHNPANDRTVFCVSRHIDANFLESYKSHPRTVEIKDPSKALVMSEWYRDALGGFDTRATTDLQISLLKVPLWRDLRAASHHPDLVARIGTRLGVLGAWLGIVGVTTLVLEYLDISRCTKLSILLTSGILLAVIGWAACRAPNLKGH